MTLSFKTTLRLTTIGALAITAAACASRPKPQPAPVAAPAPVAQTPSAPAPAPSGAPVPGSVQDFVINVGDRVYFDYDQFVVRADGQPVLDSQAQWLGRYPAVRVRIEGSADERGTREYNLALGARRANSIRDYLVGKGVSASRIDTVSFGKEKPLDPGATEEAYQRNRNGHTAITAGAAGGM